MKNLFLMSSLLMLSVGTLAQQTKNHKTHNSINKHTMNTSNVSYHTIKIEGLDIFYREAGNKAKPTILLLHGFPSSSQMYRDLINDLASDFHLVAPDFPGFGQSSAPSPAEFTYTFDKLTSITNQFIDHLQLHKITLYVQDYGGPVGFRIASQRPEIIQGLIVQNANAYTEGLGAALKPLADYMQNPNSTTEQGARALLSLDATKWQYTDGAENPANVSPDGYILDQYYLDRKGNDQIQLALFRDYANNLTLYPVWQKYFREHQPATLVISGKNDQLFTAPGAEAFKKDNPRAQINLLNGGHFALAEHHALAARLIKDFLTQKGMQ